MTTITNVNVILYLNTGKYKPYINDLNKKGCKTSVCRHSVQRADFDKI